MGDLLDLSKIEAGENVAQLASIRTSDLIAAAVEHHREVADVASERLTVVRRRRVLEALEVDFPGLTAVPRDDDGAYLLDDEARFRAEDSPELAAVVALLRV